MKKERKFKDELTLFSKGILNEKGQKIANSITSLIEKISVLPMSNEDKKAMFFGVLLTNYTPKALDALSIPDLIKITEYFNPNTSFYPPNIPSPIFSSFGSVNSAIDKSLEILKSITISSDNGNASYIEKGMKESKKFYDIPSFNQIPLVEKPPNLETTQIKEVSNEDFPIDENLDLEALTSMTLTPEEEKLILEEIQNEAIPNGDGIELYGDLFEDTDDLEVGTLGIVSIGEEVERQLNLDKKDEYEEILNFGLNFGENSKTGKKPEKKDGMQIPISEENEEDQEFSAELGESIEDVMGETRKILPKENSESKLPGLPKLPDFPRESMGDFGGVKLGDIIHGHTSKAEEEIENMDLDKEIDILLKMAEERESEIEPYENHIKPIDWDAERKEKFRRTWDKEELENHFLNTSFECKTEVREFTKYIKELHKKYQEYLREKNVEPFGIFLKYENLLSSPLINRVLFDDLIFKKGDLEAVISIIQTEKINSDLLSYDGVIFKNDNALSEEIFLRRLKNASNRLKNVMNSFITTTNSLKFLRGERNWLDIRHIFVKKNFKGGEELSNYLLTFYSQAICLMVEYYEMGDAVEEIKEKYEAINEKYLPYSFNIDEKVKLYIVNKIGKYFKKFLKDYEEYGYYKAIEKNNITPEGLIGPSLLTVLLAITSQINRNYDGGTTKRKLEKFEWYVYPLDLIFISLFIFSEGKFDPIAELLTKNNKPLWTESKFFARPKETKGLIKRMFEKFGSEDSRDIENSVTPANEEKEEIAIKNAKESFENLMRVLKELYDYNKEMDKKSRDAFLNQMIIDGISLRNEFFSKINFNSQTHTAQPDN